ncbi:MAG: DoxX family protein [Pseudomonadota bacterium]
MMTKSVSGFDPSSPTLATSPWLNRATWGLQILLALVFGAAGGAKLVGAAPMVDLFGQIGLGQWFRYFTGVIEVGSALLLFNARSAWIAASLLICTMIGAVIVHIVVVPSPPIGPLVLGTLSVVVLYRCRPKNG